MLLRSRHKLQQGKKQLGRDLNPISRQENEKTNNFKSQHERGVGTKNQLLTKEVRSRHQIEVTTLNAVESKTAKSRHGTKVAI